MSLGRFVQKIYPCAHPRSCQAHRACRFGNPEDAPAACWDGSRSIPQPSRKPSRYLLKCLKIHPRISRDHRQTAACDGMSLHPDALLSTQPLTTFTLVRGCFRRWWQVMDSNQRRLSRRFYRPILLYPAQAGCLRKRRPGPEDRVVSSAMCPFPAPGWPVGAVSEAAEQVWR